MSLKKCWIILVRIRVQRSVHQSWNLARLLSSLFMQEDLMQCKNNNWTFLVDRNCVKPENITLREQLSIFYIYLVPIIPDYLVEEDAKDIETEAIQNLTTFMGNITDLQYIFNVTSFNNNTTERPFFERVYWKPFFYFSGKFWHFWQKVSI